jgi:hypothetical protein
MGILHGRLDTDCRTEVVTAAYVLGDDDDLRFPAEFAWFGDPKRNGIPRWELAVELGRLLEEGLPQEHVLTAARTLFREMPSVKRSIKWLRWFRIERDRRGGEDELYDRLWRCIHEFIGFRHVKHADVLSVLTRLYGVIEGQRHSKADDGHAVDHDEVEFPVAEPVPLAQGESMSAEWGNMVLK